MWPTDGSNPFVLSYGDKNGFGTHADYLFGWKGDSLQRAMDNQCMFQACENGRPLKSQGVAQMNKCAVKNFAGENTDGCKLLYLMIRIPELIDRSQGSLRSLVRVSTRRNSSC
jgi:hypothetical protein